MISRTVIHVSINSSDDPSRCSVRMIYLCIEPFCSLTWPLVTAWCFLLSLSCSVMIVAKLELIKAAASWCIYEDKAFKSCGDTGERSSCCLWKSKFLVHLVHGCWILICWPLSSLLGVLFVLRHFSLTVCLETVTQVRISGHWIARVGHTPVPYSSLPQYLIS